MCLLSNVTLVLYRYEADYPVQFGSIGLLATFHRQKKCISQLESYEELCKARILLCPNYQTKPDLNFNVVYVRPNDVVSVPLFDIHIALMAHRVNTAHGVSALPGTPCSHC